MSLSRITALIARHDRLKRLMVRLLSCVPAVDVWLRHHVSARKYRRSLLDVGEADLPEVAVSVYRQLLIATGKDGHL
ncbi:hypothetical protein [Xylella fastidiosa]|uniref:Uncharacterized protein n=1 Tax=Xylella fastidiosa subsp. multiplex TaxID=644357 RepID=A0A9Q4QSJ5_XYLFS|nr:hypothetical protein [Xylella fastidiosa]ERI60021.1 hypothetical protein M233_06080 [Xylella fastidiosa subsp. multiplex Griffin-1]ACA12835.1 conserved hypothetical protein [Xylella fastidiosa M12]KFA40659.1 hypothetical protein DF22_002869 [Xylella fastidiosa]MBE0269432.1 hypothetical protein [Xylella fastidiosa subsp. multiplex]MBE0276231.1 hypothetical protein [Xylella fastidiosa subsp. multiplex]